MTRPVPLWERPAPDAGPHDAVRAYIATHDRVRFGTAFNALTAAVQAEGHWLTLPERERITLAILTALDTHEG